MENPAGLDAFDIMIITHFCSQRIPSQNSIDFRLCVVTDGRPPVMVKDDELNLPVLIGGVVGGVVVLIILICIIVACIR